jgi:hypothetical protein
MKRSFEINNFVCMSIDLKKEAALEAVKLIRRWEHDRPGRRIYDQAISWIF